MGVCSTVLESSYFGNTIRFTGLVAGLVDPALTVPKLEALADDHSELAERLKKLLDEIVASTDIRPEKAPQFAALITPDSASDNAAESRPPSAGCRIANTSGRLVAVPESADLM